MKKKHGMTQRIQKGMAWEDTLIRKIDEEKQQEKGFDMKDHVEVNENGRVWSF